MSSSPIQTLIQRPGWREILDTFKERYVTHGRICGRHRIASEIESEAVWGLMGGRRPLPVGKYLSAEKLDKGLRESAIGCGLEIVLHEYAGGSLVPRQVIRATEQAHWHETTERIIETADSQSTGPELRYWLVQDERQLRATWRRDPTAFIAAMNDCASGLSTIRANGSTPEMLAVVAARATKSPHGFDDDQLAGRLMLRLLALLNRGAPESPTSAEEKANLWREHNVEVDDISSVVHIYGATGGHPAFESATASGTFAVLTLLHVRDELKNPTTSRPYIWGIENPSVFRQLFYRAREIYQERPPCLILTSGNPSLATQLAVRQFLEADESRVFYYSGDNDQRGLELLRFWATRYPRRVVPWGMTTGSGLAPATAGPEALWQEDLLDHLWDSLVAVESRI